MPSLMKKETISIYNAREHNLRGVSINIPLNKLTVVTGISGSGKTSLVFDTLFAEGQRRFIESLSSYARQFLGKINKPNVEKIENIPPTIAISQRTKTGNARSTVGTLTELYDYLRLLYTKIGITYSPISGNIVKKETSDTVISFIKTLPLESKLLILSPFYFDDTTSASETSLIWQEKGFSRIEYETKFYPLTDINKLIQKNINHSINLLIDRIKYKPEQNTISRIIDSVSTAFQLSNGYCLVKYETPEGWKSKQFSTHFEADGLIFQEPSFHFFSYNNPLGACPTCEGYGHILGYSEELIFPNKELSVYEDGIAPWRGNTMQEFKQQLIDNAYKFNFPIHRPIGELTKEQIKLLWTGNQYFEGLNTFFKMLEANKYKIQYRVLLSRYRGKTLCPECFGTRLRKETSYVKIANHTIQDLLTMELSDFVSFFKSLELSDRDKKISKHILYEIKKRSEALINLGLGYLTLNRLSSTLSGGEMQRIRLANALGSSLVGALYILDEPTIGLHPNDTMKLLSVLNQLKALNNTIVIVEHDETIIRHADYVIDIGPFAGSNGGNVIFSGTFDKLLKTSKSLTADYITHKRNISGKTKYRLAKNFINIEGAEEHNLKLSHETVKFPLNTLTVVTGVSGSGKSTLVNDILFSALLKYLNKPTEKIGHYKKLSGDIHLIKNVEYINQEPIGRSSRSNPATYIKAYDFIRQLYASQRRAKFNGLKSSHFSFNVPGGRCDNCKGDGYISIDMQFMADVKIECDVCHGKRFKDEVLEVTYRKKNINDILNLTINEAITFFEQDKEEKINQAIINRLQYLQEVGLGYLQIGQSLSSLSGGEVQRMKLAFFLSKESDDHTLFLFDEPTTGLHFYDVETLLSALSKLINRGHSVILIEHNIDVIKSADWIIDLGPGGGKEGGHIIATGTPEDIRNNSKSLTGQFLKKSNSL